MPTQASPQLRSGPGVKGDAVVISAVALGWEMSALYAARKSTLGEVKVPDTLPAESDLRQRQRVNAGIAKVAVLIGRVFGQDLSGDAEVPSAELLHRIPDDEPAQWRQGVYTLHIQLMTALRAIDTATFHAYDVGRSLADTCRRPSDLSSLADRLERHRLLTIQGRLADLTSKLPPHSAAAVAATLEAWGMWAEEAPAEADMANLRGTLTRQGTLWRAVLTGEKDARQMVDPDSFVAAAIRLARRLGVMIRGLLRTYAVAVVLVVLAAALVVYVIVEAGGTQNVVASLGALAASLGIARKGLSLTVEDTISELRPRLWGAELDTAIAQSILRLPHSAVVPVLPVPASGPVGSESTEGVAGPGLDA